MMPETIAFFIIAFFLVLTSTFVIFLKKPHHIAFALILVFLHAAVLLILLRAEFLGIAIAIIYTAIIPILFLLLKINGAPKNHMNKYSQGGGYKFFVGSFLLMFLGEVIFCAMTWQFSPKIYNVIENPMAPREENALSIGDTIFTDCFLPFQIIGITFLATIIGLVVLSLNKKTKKLLSVSKEHPGQDLPTSIQLINVPFEKGVVRHD